LQRCDVQSLPFGDASFDAVVANHMLYHVPDLPRGLAEIQRVLKPGGTLFAATNGDSHMRELHELVQRFDPSYPSVFGRLSFTLENGNGWLSPYFEDVVLRPYASALAVTEAAPLVDYVFSMSSYTIPAAQRMAFVQYLEETLRQHKGVLHIGKDTGLFLAHKTKA
jgi:ubiquinone/menaquinone biosynthesis C-methylase UbiE